MSTQYTRSNAVLNQACLLKNYYSIGNSAYNPYSVRLVEIYDSDPRVGSPTAVASYTPTAISGNAGWYQTTVAVNILSKANTIYYDKWYHTWESGETETSVVHDFYVSRAGAVNLVSTLRTMLKDQHPDTNKRRFTDAELEIYLDNALLDINVCPPAFTDYTLDDWEANVPEWKALILQGGQIFSLIAEGTFQIGIEFVYNDNGISINTSKSQKYQSLANMLLQNYTKSKEGMKKQFWFQSSRPHALLSQALPWKLRVFSLRQWRIR